MLDCTCWSLNTDCKHHFVCLQSSKDVQRVATWSEVYVYNGTKEFKKRYKAPNNLYFSLVVSIQII